MRRSFIIIHCYNCHPYACWYPGLRKKLERDGHRVEVPAMPGGEEPVASQWLDTLLPVVESVSTPLTLIGHSLGTRAALLLLEKRPTELDQLLLVGALKNEVDPARLAGKQSGFFDHKIDLEPLKALAPKRQVLHSADDERIDIQEGKALAEEFDAKFISEQDYGHFLDDSGVDLIYTLLTGKTL